MHRVREPRTADCFKFLNSFEFENYAEQFSSEYLTACLKVNLDPINRENWPMNWEKLGRFCQEFWEELPNSPRIRYGAFFKLCDFAEDWCYGDHGI